MTFMGGKNGAGVYQRIISLIPPHLTYIEPFAGTGSILRRKRPAHRSVALDLSRSTIDSLGEAVPEGFPGLELIVGDGTEYLRLFRRSGSLTDIFVYADPPYVRSTRACPERDYYEHEWGDEDHERFLVVALAFPGQVMISGYRSALYEEMLEQGAGWRTTSFQATTRTGLAVETLWMNYPEPSTLHDYRHIGDGFEGRWRIHKRQRSWERMLRAMPPLERRAMLAHLIDCFGAEVLTHLHVDAAGDPDLPPGHID